MQYLTYWNLVTDKYEPFIQCSRPSRPSDWSSMREEPSQVSKSAMLLWRSFVMPIGPRLLLFSGNAQTRRRASLHTSCTLFGKPARDAAAGRFRKSSNLRPEERRVGKE